MKTILITGGAGFIGSNAAALFSRRGVHVVAVDNLSRPTSSRNRQWIKESMPNVDFVDSDILDRDGFGRLVDDLKPHFVLHLAAQVAVTESVRDPRKDFETNALGTLNVLEAIRAHSPAARLIYASTNKVYGDMKSLELREEKTRYFAPGLVGISEKFPLDFYSPYGCSKGAADQYVLDYARNFGLQTVSLRQSCIYGPRQFGVEDQGWMAWFAIAALRRQKFTIYGDGKQVRDALYVDDLIELYWALFESESWVGGALNVGGGLERSLSLLDYLEAIASKPGVEVDFGLTSERPGDQLWFVSDNSRALSLVGWKPEVGLEKGIGRLFDWLSEADYH